MTAKGHVVQFFIRSADQSRLSYYLQSIEDNEFSDWIESFFDGILLSSVRIALIFARRK
jgi:hypothetical protein